VLNHLLKKWIFVSAIIFLLLLLLTFILQENAIFIWDLIFNFWFPICESLTPIKWQTKGNILLGLIWLISGLAFYSMIIGLVFILISDNAKKFFIKKD